MTNLGLVGPDQSSINTVRRYYLLERHRARREQSPTEMAWQAKQEAEPGTLLPATFPMQAKLATAGYIAYADLNGADVIELRANAELTPREAEAVFDELAEFGNPDA